MVYTVEIVHMCFTYIFATTENRDRFEGSKRKKTWKQARIHNIWVISYIKHYDTGL